jgi:hypothetical protein
MEPPPHIAGKVHPGAATGTRPRGRVGRMFGRPLPLAMALLVALKTVATATHAPMAVAAGDAPAHSPRQFT